MKQLILAILISYALPYNTLAQSLAEDNIKTFILHQYAPDDHPSLASLSVISREAITEKTVISQLISDNNNNIKLCQDVTAEIKEQQQKLAEIRLKNKEKLAAAPQLAAKLDSTAAKLDKKAKQTNMEYTADMRTRDSLARIYPTADNVKKDKWKYQVQFTIRAGDDIQTNSSYFYLDEKYRVVSAQ